MSGVGRAVAKGIQALGEGGGGVGLAEAALEIGGDIHETQPQTRTEVQRNTVIPQRTFAGAANLCLCMGASRRLCVCGWAAIGVGVRVMG